MSPPAIELHDETPFRLPRYLMHYSAYAVPHLDISACPITRWATRVAMVADDDIRYDVITWRPRLFRRTEKRKLSQDLRCECFYNVFQTRLTTLEYSKQEKRMLKPFSFLNQAFL